MNSEYMKDRIVIQSHEVYLRYNHVCMASGHHSQYFSPEEALALLRWLEQHRPTFEQAVNGCKGSDIFSHSDDV